MRQFRAYVLVVVALSASIAWSQAQSAKTSPYIDLGHFKGGTWAGLQSINDFGIAMGWGNVNGGTGIRMLGVPLLGPNSSHWFESGVNSENWVNEGGGISSAGLIVGNILDPNGWPEGYAWTANHASFYLGKCSDCDSSSAIAINHLGTLIVGNSGKHAQDGTVVQATPVVWTSQVTWEDGKLTLTWQIHALPTGGLESFFPGLTLNLWGAWGVNDLGQIAGDGWTIDADGNYWEIAVVWTPKRGGTGWDVQALPMSDDFSYNEALGINNAGEIIGDVWGGTGNLQGAFPALYKQDLGTKMWSVHVLPVTSPDLNYGWSIAWGINDLGDIVGACTDENWVGKATLWNSNNLSSVKSLGFPGATSGAFGVNNLGIAVGGYWATTDTDENGNLIAPEQAVAVRFR
jgi:hypothetical protein